MERMSHHHHHQIDMNERLVVKAEQVSEEEDDYQSPTKRLGSGKKVPPLTSSIRFSRVSVKPAEKCIKLGETFQSFAEVSRAITMYEMRNKVHLTQKYFRRIAANPKPSNKEDFMLSEEERKRFVYRWVDFCCTYFDDMLARTDHDDEDGNATNQVLGFAMKECPMRIRFQLRFNEKDLMISIFREAHDHNHPASEMPTMPTLPKKPEAEITNSISVTTFTDQREMTKRLRPPPPSLSPLFASKLPKESPSTIDSDSRKSLPLLNSAQVHGQNSLPIPKPPPLKAMPLLTRSTGSPNLAPRNGHIQGLSAEGIIRNIYNYLCQMQTVGSSSDNDLQFTTTNPNLIKITSELTGVDVGRISPLCQRKQQNYKMPNARINEGPRQTVPTGSPASGPSVPKIKTASKRKQDLQSASNMGFSDITVPSLNTQPQQFRTSSFEDADASYVSMPVEVIIKAEPEEHVDYYDENDSNSSMSMPTNDDYFGSERTDAR